MVNRKLSRRGFLKTALAGLSAIALSPSTAKAEPTDLVYALGQERWKALKQDCKKHAEQSWYAEQEKNRKKILNIYENEEAFLNSLNERTRNEFEQFNRAYVRAIDGNEKYPSGRVFVPQGGKITQEYHEKFPWINLDDPTYSDRLLIFMNEQEKSRGNRINWNFVRKSGSERRFGDRDKPDRIMHMGELYIRQGKGNIYKSPSGKIMAID